MPHWESACHAHAKRVQVEYYDSLNTLVLFIMLGIGADNVFVFFDALRQAEMLREHCADLRTRMLYTMQRSIKATMVTSSTTAACFLALSLIHI